MNDSISESILVFPSKDLGYKWLVSTRHGTRRGYANTISAAWTLARLAKEALGD